MFNIKKLLNYLFDNILILTDTNNQLYIHNRNYYNLDALESGYLYSNNYNLNYNSNKN
jgi:hypothetical protein